MRRMARQRAPVKQQTGRLTPAQKALFSLSLKMLRLNPWLNVAITILGDEYFYSLIQEVINSPFEKSGWVKVEDCGFPEETLTSAHATSCGVLGITAPANWAARLGKIDNNGVGTHIGGGIYRYRMGFVANAAYDSFWNAWFHDLASRYQIDIGINTTVTEDMLYATIRKRFIGYPAPAPNTKIDWLPMLYPLAGGTAQRAIPVRFLPYRQPNPYIPPILDFVAYSPPKRSTSTDTENSSGNSSPPAGTPIFPPVVVGGGSYPYQHVMKPPMKGTKERKVRASKKTAYLFKALAAATEVGDFVDAMSDGFSKQRAKEYKKLRTLDDKLAFLYRHWLDEDFDIGKAINGLVKNQIEDAIVGRIS